MVTKINLLGLIYLLTKLGNFCLRMELLFFMSQKNRNENLFNSPALSNSRLSVQSLYTFAISVDKITIVGQLNSENEKDFSRKINSDIALSIINAKTSLVHAKHLLNGVYIEYDKFKGQAFSRRNMRIEFNPNNLNEYDKKWLKEYIGFMENKEFSRLDLAFDTNENLEDYYIFSEKSVKKTIFFGRNDKPETKYFGVRSSDRYIRIYNKKQEIKDNKDLEIDDPFLWRIEFELKREMTSNWETCFDDLNILKPDYKTISDFNTRAKVFYLMHDESAWGEMHRHTKRKFKKILKEISPINLKNNMQAELKNQKEKIQKELEFWLA